MHAHWRTFLSPRAEAAPKQLTLAAIIDHRAGDDLNVTTTSLSKYPLTWRFVVLNRSGEELLQPNVNFASADVADFESAIAAIAEDTVLLIHSGVAVEEEPFAAMLRAFAGNAADGFMPAARVGPPLNLRIVPTLGGSAPFSLYESVTYAGAILMRRDALFAAKQRRALSLDLPFLGLADFCVAGRKEIVPYPAVVLNRRRHEPPNLAKARAARVAAYSDVSANDSYYMLASGYESAISQRRRRTKRDLAFAALDMGLAPLVRIGSGALRRLRRWKP
jgi:hypothetical protein